MLIRYEKDMTPIVERWLSLTVDVIRTEVYCGFAGEYVPDIVGAVFDREKLKSLKRKNPMPRGRIKKLIAEGRPPAMYHRDLVAIELKLKNFPQAYFQAKMYQWFGMRTYIAMPKKVCVSLRPIRMEVLRIDGIGLLSVDEDGCHQLIHARKAKSTSLENEIQIAERLIPRKDGLM